MEARGRAEIGCSIDSLFHPQLSNDKGEREQRLHTTRNFAFLSLSKCEWSISITEKSPRGAETATSVVGVFVVGSQTFVSTPRSSRQVLNASGSDDKYQGVGRRQ
jgi:hypothetical protein